MGKVATDYELKGHRQVYPTNCPGEFLYQEMANYPHWVSTQLHKIMWPINYYCFL